MLKIIANDLVTDPFPYILKDGILPSEMFHRLASSFPNDEVFNEQQTEWGGGRKNLVRAMPVFQDFVRSKDPWRELYSYINSAAFIDQLLKIFGEAAIQRGADIDLEHWSFSDYVEPLHLSASGKMTTFDYYMERTKVKKILNWVGDKIMGDKLYVTFDIARSGSGYQIPVHCDNRYKMFFMLIYFNSVSDEGGTGGQLHLHKHKLPLADEDYPRYPDEENTEIVATVSPKPNLGVIGLNCNNSYHSAASLQIENGYRNFLYIGVCKRYTGNMWAKRVSVEHSANARGVGVL